MYEKTQALLKQLVELQIVPGLSYAIINYHQVVQDVLGQREVVPNQMPLTPGLCYDLASLTKVVGTSTSIFNLIAHQQLDLTTPVHFYLPEFSDKRVQIRHLLTHTSGIAGYIPHRDQLDAVALKQALLQLSVTADFDKKVIYTDLGFLYLGWILEEIYQQPVQQVITEQVLQPLKMTQTTFRPDPNNCVPTTFQDGYLRQGIVHDPKARTLGIHCGSAGLFAPLNDLIQFSQWYLGQRPDLPTLMGLNFRQQLSRDWTTAQGGRSLAWDLRQNPVSHRQLLFHTGYTGTFMLLDLQQQQGLVVLSNRIHPIEKNDRFLNARETIVQQFIQELPKITD